MSDTKPLLLTLKSCTGLDKGISTGITGIIGILIFGLNVEMSCQEGLMFDDS